MPFVRLWACQSLHGACRLGVEVRKELRGKYKRHYWPENPFEAIATSKTKKHLLSKKFEI